MSDIRGILQEITSKPGKSKKTNKPYVMYGVKVDGEYYGTAFDKVKAAVGDTVEFDVEERGEYKNVADGTFRVVKQATSQESAAVSQANAANGDAKQSSIENQKALEYATAITLAVADEGSGIDEVLSNLQKAFKVCSNLLHPTAPAAAKPAAKKAPAKVEEEEDDSDVPY